MKKQVTAFLLSLFMAVSFLTEGISASPAADEKIETVGSVLTEDMEAMTGRQQMRFIELPPDELPEIYEEPQQNAVVKGSAAYRTKWDSYSTNYYYNQLGDNEREFWDALDQMCYEYLTGTETLTDSKHFTDVKSGLDFNYYMTKAVIFKNMSAQAARNIIYMFIASNPQYYFLQTILSGTSGAANGGYAFLSINETFANGTKRKAETQKIQTMIDSWLAQVSAEPTALLKEKKIHDLICEKVTYDPYYNSIQQNRYNQTMYSVFCTDTTVCAGYSQAMQLLCNAVGIDCVSVTSEDHQWNIIRLNDNWYYLDVTWNDNIADSKNMKSAYQYFNRSRQNFMSDRKDLTASHTPEAMWTGYLPELPYDSGASELDIGTIYTPQASLSAPQITASEDKVQIVSPEGGTVYYTINGTNPSVAFTKAKKYTGPFTLKAAATVKAIAVKTGYLDSRISQQAVVPQYRITFQGNGGYIQKKSVKMTSKLLNPSDKIGKTVNAKRKNYAFLGWYTKKSGGKKLDETAKVSSSQTYYAHWAKIKPTQAKISSVKNSSAGKLKVKIKNNKTASGYQIRYSTRQNMSSARTVQTEETSYILKKLKRGSTYYVQVRMYQKESVSGKKKYGAWSKPKSVKLKK